MNLLDSGLRDAICNWIVECEQFICEEDEEEARSGLIDRALIKWIDKEYSGGFRQFFIDYENNWQ